MRGGGLTFQIIQCLPTPFPSNFELYQHITDSVLTYLKVWSQHRFGAENGRLQLSKEFGHKNFCPAPMKGSTFFCSYSILIIFSPRFFPLAQIINGRILKNHNVFKQGYWRELLWHLVVCCTCQTIQDEAE